MFTVNNLCSTVTAEGIFPILKNDTYFKSRCGKITESALIFCTMLSFRYYYYKDKDEEEGSNPFQQISSHLVIKMLGRDSYRGIMKRLEELHIIETDHKYMAGVKSKSYRLNDSFTGQRLIARKLKYEASIQRMERLNEHFMLKGLKNYPYLLQQYESLKRIHIDSIGAMAWIEENKDKVVDGEKLINNIDYYYRSVRKIENGYTLKIAVSQANMRLHSSMTNFPRLLRPFLGLVNKETGELRRNKCTIDCKNSQPLIISVLMERAGVMPDADYKKYCFDGAIYDVIAAELQEPKQWCKDRFMDCLLFTPENSDKTRTMKKTTGMNTHKRKFTRYFSARFPIVYEWLLETKRNLKLSSAADTKNKHNVGGSVLAYQVQKIEASLWIHSLLKEVPADLIYCSIHDSIMMFSPTDEQVHFVLEKLHELGKDLYGLEKLPLKIEYEF